MTADLKPCPFCGMAPSRSYGGRSGNRIWCANERCQERPLIAAETWSGAASIWNPIAPTVSDPGPGTSGFRTPQPEEAPVSDASAPAWQPIATAPRDGTPVLTYSADAAADPRQGPVGNPGTPILVMAYIVGEWELVDEIGDWHIPQYDPTHWMPLPAQPVDASAAPSTPVDNKISADPVGKEG